MYKRGYEDGVQTLEIYEGKVDVVLYNNKPEKPSFYFYRFPSTLIFNGERIRRDVTIVHRHEVEAFLKQRGLGYESLIKTLLKVAWATDMPMRDEM
jgi:hypothetical protein